MCAFQAKLRRVVHQSDGKHPRPVGHTALNEHLKRINSQIGTAFIPARARPPAPTFAALQIPPNQIQAPNRGRFENTTFTRRHPLSVSCCNAA